MSGTCYALVQPNTPGPWYGGLVLGPDFASNSQYDLSSGSLGTSVCSIRGDWMRCLLSSFSALTPILESLSWCVNTEVHGDSWFVSRKDQCSVNGSKPCGKSALERPPVQEATCSLGAWNEGMLVSKWEHIWQL